MHPSKQPPLFLLFLGRDFVPRKQIVLSFLCNNLPYLEPYLVPYHEQARAQGLTRLKQHKYLAGGFEQDCMRYFIRNKEEEWHKK